MKGIFGNFSFPVFFFSRANKRVLVTFVIMDAVDHLLAKMVVPVLKSVTLKEGDISAHAFLVIPVTGVTQHSGHATTP